MSKEIRIDLRPHYTFAYYQHGMEFEHKTLLYYSKKDKALHYKYKAPIEDFRFDGREDMENSVPISDEDAQALERVFGIMADAIGAVKKPWMVCDGCFCVVICGKRRVNYQGPACDSPFSNFDEMIDRLFGVMEKWNQADFEEAMKQVPKVAERLENYIAGNK